MKEETKLVHIMIIDGGEKEIALLGKVINQLKEKMPNFEFLVTNDRIQIQSVDYMINELKKVQKIQAKMVKEAKKNDGKKE